MIKCIFFLLIFVCLLCCLSLSSVLRAQTASVGGVIRDPSEQFVSGAKVTLQNTQTGISREASTNDEGIFWFATVAPGPYAISVEREGFKAIHINDLTLTVNQSFTFEAHLELGPVATTTEVRASELPLIDLDNAQISNLVDSRRIQDLPLLTRNPYELVLLSPGVIQSNSTLGGFSTNGTNERNNNFLLDGVDNNDTDVPGAPGGLNALNPDSAQESRVITNNYARNMAATMAPSSRSLPAAVPTISTATSIGSGATTLWAPAIFSIQPPPARRILTSATISAHPPADHSSRTRPSGSSTTKGSASSLRSPTPAWFPPRNSRLVNSPPLIPVRVRLSPSMSAPLPARTTRWGCRSTLPFKRYWRSTLPLMARQ
ncbi:MAG TPA: carboxypeptidase-like regulatory domain-containing protein [Candidatus Eremiobacteraceae bacterium]|nr:carboxypeptidase-like regulatory domain-containing protein [Candidatus Eremiobacteraceae bacterium]